MSSYSPSEPPLKKTKLSMDSYEPSLTILVGDNKKEFNIQKVLICQESEFFKRASTKLWKSGQTRIIILEEEEPEIFSIFLAWLLTGSFDNSAEYIRTPVYFDDSCEAEKDANSRTNGKQRGQLFKCYVLGDMLQAPNFCNQVTDAIVANYRTNNLYDERSPSVSDECINYIFSHTIDTSSLRRLIVDYCLSITLERRMPKPCHSESLLQFYHSCYNQACGLLDLHQRPIAVWRKRVCAYHSHPNQPVDYECSTLTHEALFKAQAKAKFSARGRI